MLFQPARFGYKCSRIYFTQQYIVFHPFSFSFLCMVNVLSRTCSVYIWNRHKWKCLGIHTLTITHKATYQTRTFGEHGCLTRIRGQVPSQETVVFALMLVKPSFSSFVNDGHLSPRVED